MKMIIVLCAILFSCLSHASTQNFYYGSVNYYSADGLTSMGKTVSLVSRIVDPKNSQITETITQPKEDQPGVNEFVTKLSLKTGNTFKASDANDTFSGEITFFGDTWNWQSWDYNLSLKSGGNIIGSGFLSAIGIQTNKTLRAPNFEMKILEDLKVISASEYEIIRKRLLGN